MAGAVWEFLGEEYEANAESFLVCFFFGIAERQPWCSADFRRFPFQKSSWVVKTISPLRGASHLDFRMPVPNGKRQIVSSDQFDLLISGSFLSQTVATWRRQVSGALGLLSFRYQPPFLFISSFILTFPRSRPVLKQSPGKTGFG